MGSEKRREEKGKRGKEGDEEWEMKMEKYGSMTNKCMKKKLKNDL